MPEIIFEEGSKSGKIVPIFLTYPHNFTKIQNINLFQFTFFTLGGKASI